LLLHMSNDGVASELLLDWVMTNHQLSVTARTLTDPHILTKFAALLVDCKTSE
jgi:pheromone shutdown protein TraB